MTREREREMLQIIGGFCVGITAMVAWHDWHKRTRPETVDHLRVAYEMGVAEGGSMYCHDQDPPAMSTASAAYIPAEDQEPDGSVLYPALIAYGRGRHDGWWENASTDLIVQTYDWLDKSTKKEGK